MYLTPSDRGFLMWELADFLNSMGASPSTIRKAIGDIHEKQNSIFYETMVATMPDCMDALAYHNQRQLELS